MADSQDYNLQKKRSNYLSSQMHKNMGFKIHKQKLTLGSEPRLLKENLKTAKDKQEINQAKAKEVGLQERPRSIRSKRKSKSMAGKINVKENMPPISPIQRLPSIRALNKQDSVQLIDDHCAGIAFISKNQTVRALLSTFIQMLTKKQLKFQALKSSFLIQKTYFINIFEYFLVALRTNDRSELHYLFHELSQLTCTYQQLIDYFVNNHPTHKQRLSLNSSIISEKIIIKAKEQKPQQINKQADQKSLFSRVEALLKQQQRLQCQNLKLGHQLQQKSAKYCNYEYQARQLQTRCSFLKRQISDLEERYTKARADSQEMYCYIGTQKNAILKMVSAQYKQIEEDMYEYATYLQANVLASELGYEPHPYHQIQTLMKEQLDELVAIKDYSKESGSKSSRLAEFAKKVLSFLGKKDSEVGRLLEFKTNCIRTFVKNMKKWLENWTLKQEYLCDLRVGFSADASAFKKAYRMLEDAVDWAEPVKANLLNLYEIFSKMEENYKLGNSFY